MPDRKQLPDVVEDRVRRDYDARLNPDDRTHGEDELTRPPPRATPCSPDAST